MGMGELLCFCKEREWLTGGFLHGPMLPIYGSGAIIVLLCTIGVRDQIVLTFLFGMIGATILEYVTGACMERLFRVRYWDYSHMPLNLKGYICLPVSLGWGVFSVLLMRVIHVPIENLVLQIPERIAEVVSVVCSSAFAVDFTLSFSEAMDLRDMLIRLSDSNEKIQRLQKRLEVVSAFAEDGLMQYQMKREERKMSRKEFLERMIERQRENRRMMLVELIDRVNESIDAGLEKREELQKIKTQIEQEFKNIGSLTNGRQDVPQDCAPKSEYGIEEICRSVKAGTGNAEEKEIGMRKKQHEKRKAFDQRMGGGHRGHHQLCVVGKCFSVH